ncbi:MAG: methyltransferase domain-containing protein [Bacteriovorax sp.]|nr:methyltransferase domain-containing protein [Bacteriovorax sp.]
MSNIDSLLNKRCKDSKGTSAEHLYSEIEALLKLHLNYSATILDLGAGIGNLKKFLAKNNSYKIEEADYTFSEKREMFHQLNLNELFDLQKKFDAITVVEVLHFMENPRHLMRQASLHLGDSGYVIVSIPNLHSLTSLLSLIFRGVHSAFAGKNYPAHITPLHKIDILRILGELQMKNIQVYPSQLGRMPGLKCYWQRLFPGSRNLFINGVFSDNLIFIAKK